MAAGRRYRSQCQIIMHIFVKAKCHCIQCGSPDRFNVGNSLPRLVNQNIGVCE